MPWSLRTSLLALSLAGLILPVVGLAVFEQRALADARDDERVAEFQVKALAAAIRAEGASTRGLDPIAAASEGIEEEVMLVGPDGAEWPAFRERAGEALAGAMRIPHPTQEREVEVAWGRAPTLDADLVLFREPLAPTATISFPFFLLGAFLLSGAVVLLVFVALRILAPLARLEEASRRLARGEWGERVEDAGPIEVRALAVSFNTMAESLARQRADLDALLGERTRALATRESDLDTLSFTIAHEFREPLRSLRWIADDLLEGDLDADAREGLERLRKRIDDIDAVFADLLRYERVSREPAPMEPVSLASLLDDATEDQEGRVALRRTNLPEVVASPELIGTAFREVIENAASHASGPEGTAQVDVSAKVEDEAVVVRVDDHGPGIPVARRDDVVHLFHRLKRDSPGTGAGLAIARRALQRHGGDLALDEAPGGGTRVEMRIPLVGRDVGRLDDLPPGRRF